MQSTAVTQTMSCHWSLKAQVGVRTSRKTLYSINIYISLQTLEMQPFWDASIKKYSNDVIQKPQKIEFRNIKGIIHIFLVKYVLPK